MYKKFNFVCLFSMMFLLTGCWDQVESEERGYVIGVGIDTSDKDTLKDREEEEVTEATLEKERFKVTYQFVVPSALRGKAEGGQAEDPFLNTTIVGNTMFKIVRDMSKKLARSPYFEHIKTIIISEELAKKGYFPEVLDIFLRDHEMRRGTKVIISKGKSQEVLESGTKVEKLPVMYIDSITENAFKNGEMLPPTIIGDVHKFLLGSNSFVIPTIESIDHKVNLSGSAIFQGNSKKMIGTLNGKETMGLNFITDELQGGVLELPVKGHLVVFEIKGSKRKIQANLTNKDQIDFTINIDTEGNLGENFNTLDLLVPKTISKIEERVTEEIEKLTTDVIERTQQDYKVDVLGLGSYLNQNHYDFWKSVEKNWDSGQNYFSKSKIHVKAKVTVRNIGSTIETQK
jgi:spore germination protein